MDITKSHKGRTREGLGQGLKIQKKVMLNNVKIVNPGELYLLVMRWNIYL
jgi:hypothetical protein